MAITIFLKNFVLNIEQVFLHQVVALGLNVIAVDCIDKLGVDA